MNNIKFYNEFLTTKTMNEDNFGGGGHDATGRGTGYYKDTVTYDKPIYFTFSSSELKTGSDEVIVKSKPYLDLKSKLSQILSSSMGGKKADISIVGGASNVGTAEGYNNQRLAERRAEKLRDQLIKDIPGIESKVTFKTSGKVGKSVKYNSPEALKEQFVMVSISLPGEGIIKTGNEVDNAAVDTGFKRFKEGDIKIVDEEKRVCLRIPNSLVDDFQNVLREFKNKHLLKNIPFSVNDVK